MNPGANHSSNCGMGRARKNVGNLKRQRLTCNRSKSTPNLNSANSRQESEGFSTTPSRSSIDCSMLSGMSSQDCIRMSALKAATVSNPWLIPILETAWNQVYAWVISLGVCSANVVRAAWRVWSDGVNRLLGEILERDSCGHVIGFEFMDLLQICLIFLNNYLRYNQKEDKCVYRMLA
uniref:Uncharacterized protein n=1 Tax=Strigamia maritima TaxID=126957 RepID=T1JEN5_STRMM